jgi:hypothetical protein
MFQQLVEGLLKTGRLLGLSRLETISCEYLSSCLTNAQNKPLEITKNIHVACRVHALAEQYEYESLKKEAWKVLQTFSPCYLTFPNLLKPCECALCDRLDVEEHGNPG